MRAAKFILLAFILGQCLTGRLAIDNEAFSAYIHTIPFRGGEETCIKSDVYILVRGYEFTVKSNALTLTFRRTHIINTSPDLLIGESYTGMQYIIYYYAYRGRLYVQITPIPRGYSEAIENEIAYIITTDQICN